MMVRRHHQEGDVVACTPAFCMAVVRSWVRRMERKLPRGKTKQPLRTCPRRRAMSQGDVGGMVDKGGVGSQSCSRRDRRVSIFC